MSRWFPDQFLNIKYLMPIFYVSSPFPRLSSSLFWFCFYSFYFISFFLLRYYCLASFFLSIFYNLFVYNLLKSGNYSKWTSCYAGNSEGSSFLDYFFYGFFSCFGTPFVFNISIMFSKPSSYILKYKIVFKKVIKVFSNKKLIKNIIWPIIGNYIMFRYWLLANII